MPRAFASEFTLRVGPLTVRGRLMPLSKSEDRRYKLATSDGLPVEQVYQDEKGRTWRRDELVRAIVEEDELSLVDMEELAEARTSPLPDNIMNVSVHPADQVKECLFPADSKAYVFDPLIKKGRKIVDDPDNDELYVLILRLIEQADDVVFLAKVSFSGKEKLYRLFAFNGKLMIQHYLYPENFNEYDINTDIPISNSDMAKGLAVINSLVRPFDPESYNDEERERLDALDAVTVDPDVVVEPRTKSKGQDLSALLDAALAEVAH